MRYIRIASAKNPDTDFIGLNDFNGFLCTQFQPLGISRNVEVLTIKNRSIPVSNKPAFKKYRLVIEIFSAYSLYENKYYELMNFLDRNKKDGLRLYYTPYTGMEEKYCLCSIESSTKTEKRQPVVLNLAQNSLWLGQKQTEGSSQVTTDVGNLFVFNNDNGYYSASFSEDAKIDNYYSVAFYTGIKQQVEINISSYNEVPLNITVKGKCINPQVFLYRKNEEEPLKKFQVFHTFEDGSDLEIRSGILENGVWRVDRTTGARQDLTELVDYSNGSPYFYLENGDYIVTVLDGEGNKCEAEVSWQEEYSE